jgi:hypothetical protein
LKRSEIIIPAKPFNLWPGVTVNNIAFLILKIPRDHNENISFPDLRELAADIQVRTGENKALSRTVFIYKIKGLLE